MYGSGYRVRGWWFLRAIGIIPLVITSTFTIAMLAVDVLLASQQTPDTVATSTHS